MKRGLRAALVFAALLATGAGAAARPGATLAVERGGAWREWWRADAAPVRWSGPDTVLTGALAWRPLADGAEWAETRLAGEAPAWRMRLVVVRLDPARVRFETVLDLDPGGGRAAWNVERMPTDALVALNAGQFLQTLPWGWVVSAGRERFAPGKGPLSTAFAVDTAGRVRWIAGDSLAPPPAGVACAFQSYPTLLDRDGTIPAPLLAPGRGVNLHHRDTRLAIGADREGRVLVAMTRWDAFGEAGNGLPIGPTSPEMAAVMGALGARDAVMLDGGVSAQLALRERATGRVHRWTGLRRVPLALVVRAR